MISSRAPFLNQSTNPVTIETENIDDDLGSSSKATDYKTKTHALIAKKGKIHRDQPPLPREARAEAQLLPPRPRKHFASLHIRLVRPAFDFLPAAVSESCSSEKDPSPLLPIPPIQLLRSGDASSTTVISSAGLQNPAKSTS